MYRHILVPLDGSTLAEAVLPFVELLAKAGSAKVTLVTVGEPPADNAPPGQQAAPSSVERGAQHGEGIRDETGYGVGLAPRLEPSQHSAYLDQMVARIIAYGKVYLNHVARRLQNKDVDTEVEVLLGRPADQIADYAQEHSVGTWWLCLPMAVAASLAGVTAVWPMSCATDFSSPSC